MIDARNILLIRLKSMGDIVLTLPAVNVVRANYPQARLVFLTSKEHAGLLEGFSEVNDVLTLNRAAFRQKNLMVITRNLFDLLRQFRRRRFDLTVDFQGYGETGLLTWITRARHRCGSVYGAHRGWGYTHGVARNDRVHPVEWNLELLQRCGLHPAPLRNEFRLAEDHVRAAQDLLVQWRCDPAKPLLFIQPFTSSPQKNWPLEKSLALARHWRERSTQVIFGGGPADRQALGTVQEAGFAVAAGAPLLTMAGLMKLASLIVGGDTGVLHLAVAMGRRVLMLMRRHGGGDPIPFGHGDWVVARAGADVAEIEVQQVIEASTAALRETTTKVQAHA